MSSRFLHSLYLQDRYAMNRQRNPLKHSRTITNCFIPRISIIPEVMYRYKAVRKKRADVEILTMRFFFHVSILNPTRQRYPSSFEELRFVRFERCMHPHRQ